MYHFQISQGFVNWSFVNILLAIRLFWAQWTGHMVLISCDNVVAVLTSGRIRDPYLSACVTNIWYVPALADIDLHYAYIRGLDIDLQYAHIRGLDNGLSN